jgi:16S rRNA (uracil1498-N3)-methyltransferase
MKNIPRIFVGENINSGDLYKLDRDVVHYLTKVMRTRNCLVFGDGNEYNACLSDDGQHMIVGSKTDHKDPSNDIVLMFSPIKRTDDMLNMATQMGVGVFQPVITERTNSLHINWQRMNKIVTEAAEQSNRNTVPKILPPIKFSDINLSDVVFADERFAYKDKADIDVRGAKKVLIGPEGGFSDAEFSALDMSGARGFSLGKTILRAELAASIAVSRVVK